jgi:hypothetical protein
MEEIDQPNRALERQLREAVMRSLNELLPEFRVHVRRCTVCEKFHDWMTWKHEPGTTEWVATCPETGVAMTLPLQFGT